MNQTPKKERVAGEDGPRKGEIIDTQGRSDKPREKNNIRKRKEGDNKKKKKLRGKGKRRKTERMMVGREGKERVSP